MFFKRSVSSISWIVVFLGNPGGKYTDTRHNVGFMTASALEKSKGINISKLKYKSLTAVCELGGEKVLLMKPQTFMNLSGNAVREAASFFKVPTDHIIVISDDVTLPVGKLRIRRSGSAGGHNGLKDIIAKCGGEGFPRIKIGVGAPPENWDMVNWVLSGFKGQDAADIAKSTQQAADAIEEIIKNGIDRAMNIYN